MEASDAGCGFCFCRAGVFRRRHRLHPDLRAAVMSADYILAAFVTLGVLGYLVYALIRPERF
jgi:K+-transporting ATPase KdpF subunit